LTSFRIETGDNLFVTVAVLDCFDFSDEASGECDNVSRRDEDEIRTARVLFLFVVGANVAVNLK
jgi:hypothetical protein